MRKILIFCTLVIAIVALLGVSQAMASGRPTVCLAGSDITLVLDTGSPTYVDGDYEFSYTATCTSAAVCGKINKLVMTFPTVAYLPQELEVDCDGCDVHPIAEGDPSTTMGDGIMGVAVTIPAVEGANDNEVKFSIRSNVPTVGIASVGFNFGRDKLIPCFQDAVGDLDDEPVQPYVGGIASAGFDPVIPDGAALTECVATPPVGSMEIIRNPYTGCGETVYHHPNSGDCSDSSPDLIPPGTDDHLISCTAPGGNQLCQECLEHTESTPCYTYKTGRVTYRLPYCDPCNPTPGIPDCP